MLVFKERSVIMKSKKAIYRWTVYILGFILLAMGIVLNTKCGLGVSPIISVAYTFSLILGTKIGNTTLVLYSVFVLFEIILHAIRKCPKKIFLFDILQIAVSVIFTRFINLFSDFIPQLDVVYKNQWQGSMPFRIFVLFIAITLTGLGAAMSLNMRLVPNPGDGIVQAVADTIKKPVGFTKKLLGHINGSYFNNFNRNALYKNCRYEAQCIFSRNKHRYNPCGNRRRQSNRSIQPFHL